jgi:hypothetical protein
MRMGISVVSNKLFTSALQMPEDAVVHDIEMDFETHSIRVKWSSEKCPEVVEGNELAQVGLRGVR